MCLWCLSCLVWGLEWSVRFHHEAALRAQCWLRTDYFVTIDNIQEKKTVGLLWRNTSTDMWLIIQSWGAESDFRAWHSGKSVMKTHFHISGHQTFVTPKGSTTLSAPLYPQLHLKEVIIFIFFFLAPHTLRRIIEYILEHTWNDLTPWNNMLLASKVIYSVWISKQAKGLFLFFFWSGGPCHWVAGY